ncbi:MAG: Bug family tripartite tricarboxylate transporter substrate binding protein [Burkholderiales bacterium]
MKREARYAVAAAYFALGSFPAGAAQPAETYPVRPIRVIIPYVAGASYDTIMRIVAEPMSAALRQPIIVENRAGASGTIGVDLLAKASPDGYTIGMLGDNHTILPALGQKTPYDLFRDFEPLTRIAMLDNVVVAHPSLPAKTFKELVTVLKASPGKYRYGSGGTAGSTHFAGARFAQAIGADLLHVPYKGGGLAVLGLAGGEVHLMVPNMISVKQHVHAGRFRAYAVAAKKRSSHLPEVPSATEVGLPGFEVSQFYSVFAPAKTPRPVLARLEKELKAAVALDTVRTRLVAQGADPYTESPQELMRFIKSEIQTHRETAKAANIRTQ